MQSKKTNKILSLLTALCLVPAMLPPAATAAYAADTEPAAGDTVYFGNYPQGKSAAQSPGEGRVYVDSDNGDGTEYDGWYDSEPIEWRVLENANGKLFLLSEKNLDAKPYHLGYEAVTWERSTIRSWLNGYGAGFNDGGASGIDYSGEGAGFINTTFTEAEREAIATTYVANDDNPNHGTTGGNDTDDKIFLLSIAEATNTAYGFTGDYAQADTRVTVSTAYVESLPYMNGSGSADYWLLRSPGSSGDCAAYVDGDGRVDSGGVDVDDSFAAARPALNLNPESVFFKSESGKNFAIPKSSETITYPGVSLREVTVGVSIYSNAVAPSDAANGNRVTVNDTSATAAPDCVFGGYNTSGASIGNTAALNAFS
jgi:hypothetical protein